MGLTNDALGEFEKAARDPKWRARALIMTAIIQQSTGDVGGAIVTFESALEAAQTPDERSQAAYELGLIHENQGAKSTAAEYFEQASPGFRERDEKLTALKA